MVVGGASLGVLGAGRAGAGRDQLADDDVLLQTEEPIALGLDGRLGEHSRGLLEGGRREPRVGGQRGLRDAHHLGTALRRHLALLHEQSVGVGVDLLIDSLAGEEGSEEHTSELQSLMRISYAVFFLKKKNNKLGLPNDN